MILVIDLELLDTRKGGKHRDKILYGLQVREQCFPLASIREDMGLEVLKHIYP